jgi:hypothetical protein
MPSHRRRIDPAAQGRFCRKKKKILRKKKKILDWGFSGLLLMDSLLE